MGSAIPDYNKRVILLLSVIQLSGWYSIHIFVFYKLYIASAWENQEICQRESKVIHIKRCLDKQIHWISKNSFYKGLSLIDVPFDSLGQIIVVRRPFKYVKKQKSDREIFLSLSFEFLKLWVKM